MKNNPQNRKEKLRGELMIFLNTFQGRDPMHDGNFRKAIGDFFEKKLEEELQKTDYLSVGTYRGYKVLVEKGGASEVMKALQVDDNKKDTPEKREEKEEPLLARFYSLYREGRKKDKAPQGYIDFFKARTFLLEEKSKAFQAGREEALGIIEAFRNDSLNMTGDTDSYCEALDDIKYLLQPNKTQDE